MSMDPVDDQFPCQEFAELSNSLQPNELGDLLRDCARTKLSKVREIIPRLSSFLDFQRKESQTLPRLASVACTPCLRILG
jgi:hypothetical protein